MMTHDLRRLGPAGTLLLAAFLATCGGADTCVQSKCTSGASLAIPLASPPASGTTVTVCRNAECYTAALPELPAAAEASAGLAFTGVTFVVGTLWQDANHSVGLDVEWQAGGPDAVVDGDHYVVTLTLPSGASTTLLDQIATYSTLPPDPKECSPEPTRRIAQLTP